VNDSALIHGVMAEFATPEAAAHAARSMRESGFQKLEAYGPFPSDELATAIGFRENKIARCVLIGGIVGGLTGWALQYWASVLDYPHNIGGRPYNSWPSFIPIIFELTVLFATLTGIGSLLFLNRLPRLSHPVFSVPSFVHASTDHFFVCVRPVASEFDPAKVRSLLKKCEPLSVTVIEEENKP
jgi:hypothetical protein